jgi:hypothetical protein
MPNIMPYTWVNKTLVETNISSGYGSGTIADITDNNVSTYRLWGDHHGGDGSCRAYQTFEGNWASPMKVNSVYANCYQGTYGGNYKQTYMTFYVALNINGSWVVIDSWSPHSGADGYGSNYWAYEYYERTVTTGWTNVTGVRVYMYGEAYSYEGDRQQYAALYNREVIVDAVLSSGMAYII